MRKADIKVGEEYAATPGRKYSRYAAIHHVRVLALDSEYPSTRRTGSMGSRTSCTRRGIKVEYVEKFESTWGRDRLIEVGDIRHLRSGADLFLPWAEYEEDRRMAEALKAEREKQYEADKEACYQMMNALSGFGIEAHESSGSRGIVIAPSEANKLLAALGESE